MAKQKEIIVKDTTIRSFSQNGWDYICITDIARQKNAIEPKDVVKNWMRLKNTIEYLGMWEALNNPLFKGVEFDPLLREAGSNAFTLSPVFINEGLPQGERLQKLNQIAIQQMTVLENVESKHILKA
jgi:hypothetical protein